MASDSNLIKAAFSAASTKYGAQVPNMSNLYAGNASISKNYLNLITGAMDEYKLKKDQNRQAKDTQLNAFIEKAEAGMQMLVEQEQPMPDVFINAVEEEIERLQQDFEDVNTIGKGDTKENKRARRVIMGKLNRVTQGIIKTRGQFSAFGVNAKNINKELAPDDIDAAMAIIDLKNWNNSENGQLSVSFDENGVPLFTVKNYHYSGAKIDPKTGEILSPESRWGDAVTMNMDQLLEMFPVQNFDFDAEMLSDLTDTQKKGKLNGKGGTYDFKTKQNRSSFIGKFEGDDGRKLFHDIANRRLKNLGMPSLKEALLDDISVPISILDNMFVDDGDDRINIGQVFKELDIDGSGFVDQADITLASKLPENAFVEFESNIEIMLDSLTNVNNEAFDMSRSLELLADYYIGSEAISGVGGEVIRPAIKGVSQQYYDEAYNLGVKTQEEINYNDNKNPKNPQYVKINDNRGSVKFELAIEKVRQIKDGTSAVKDWDDNIWVPDGKGNWTNKDYVDPNTKKPKPITSDQLVRLESFSLDNYLDVYDPNAFPRKKLLLNLGSQFSDMQGNNREAQYYINKPIEFSQVLNRDFNTKDFSHEGNNLVVDIGNNQEAVFDLSQKSELEALLKYLNRNKNIYTTRV